MTRRLPTLLGVSIGTLIAISSLGIGQDKPKLGFKDTPMLPGDKWHVHDGDRPQPPVITPGTCSTEDLPGQAPSDAVVLFDGKDLSHWRNHRGEPAEWDVKDGAIVIEPGKGNDPVAGGVRRLSDPPGIRVPGSRARARPGPGQQRRADLRPL